MGGGFRVGSLVLSSEEEDVRAAPQLFLTDCAAFIPTALGDLAVGENSDIRVVPNRNVPIKKE